MIRMGLRTRIRMGLRISIGMGLRTRIRMGLRIRIGMGFIRRIEMGLRTQIRMGLRTRIRIRLRIRTRVGLKTRIGPEDEDHDWGWESGWDRGKYLGWDWGSGLGLDWGPGLGWGQDWEVPGPASVNAGFDAEQTAIVVAKGVGDHSAAADRWNRDQRQKWSLSSTSLQLHFLTSRCLDSRCLDISHILPTSKDLHFHIFTSSYIFCSCIFPHILILDTTL